MHFIFFFPFSSISIVNQLTASRESASQGYSNPIEMRAPVIIISSRILASAAGIFGDVNFTSPPFSSSHSLRKSAYQEPFGLRTATTAGLRLSSSVSQSRIAPISSVSTSSMIISNIVIVGSPCPQKTPLYRSFAVGDFDVDSFTIPSRYVGGKAPRICRLGSSQRSNDPCVFAGRN